LPTANIRSYTTKGIATLAVDIEVHISTVLPALTIAGMPKAPVRESRERVRSAILNSNLEFPYRRVANRKGLASHCFSKSPRQAFPYLSG